MVKRDSGFNRQTLSSHASGIRLGIVCVAHSPVPHVQSVITSAGIGCNTASEFTTLVTYSYLYPWSRIKILTIRNDFDKRDMSGFARHIDMFEVGMDTAVYTYEGTQSADIKALNPTIQTYGYDFDLTICQHSGCYQGSTANTALASLPEDQYLHFSQDTHLKFVSLEGTTVVDDLFVPGCPTNSPITAACRVQEFMWRDLRWAVNVKNTTWQQWYANHLLQETYHTANNQPDPVDGILLDEHGIGYAFSHAIGTQTMILSGGGIREYGGLVPQNISSQPPDALDIAYNTDVVQWLTYLRTQFDAAGKFLMPNTAEYFMNTLLFTQNQAAGGAYTELLHAADHFRFGAPMYQQFLDQVHQLTTTGGTVELAFDPCTFEPAGYTNGNYPTARSRYKMWSLASYYMSREFPTDSGRAYFDPSLCINPDGPDPLDFRNQWLTAYEFDVGQPIDTATITKQGAQSCTTQGYAVFARHYTNALVLLRTRDDYGCQDYGDTTGVNVPLDTPMQILQPDGTLSANTSSVTLRNAEAVILIPAADNTAPARVNDLQVL